ncbi:hypothetical protein SAMN05421820_101701 [Pedobacter steynii]|uniref:Transmembrane protein n=1 Tax=Pedobacter steynii TaxID=430522 RepID=A0A1G9KXI6_9SPHI|nr:hypothetical protein [Pedobacter steynii]NQX38670.1 hypothetical protein [Pedobacter steynii]SDL54422.1 hypothetical protein SAMN05421820_101701 [Pedobacter steynii]
MKRGALIFWTLYSLFFAIPFPMIIYYSTSNPDDINNLRASNPWLSLGILAASVILWLIVLIVFYHKWVLNVFTSKKNIEYLKKEGEPREARILSVNKLRPAEAKMDTYELALSFKNLVGTEIVQKSGVNDSKPFERRYEVGKKVTLLIDKEMKRIPYFIFSGTQIRINKRVVLLRSLGWLALVAVLSGYYVYAYQSESHGMGWRFMSFGHPLIVCPLILLFYRILVDLIVNKLGGDYKDNTPLIKFKGIKTNARLISASQTGTYINEQPMIRFELEYTDEKQQKHNGNIKKIVNLLDLNSIKVEYVEIFYLKSDPKRIAFASDLNELS